MRGYLEESLLATSFWATAYVPMAFLARYMRNEYIGNDMASYEPFIYGALTAACVEIFYRTVQKGDRVRGAPSIIVASSLAYLVAAKMIG